MAKHLASNQVAKKKKVDVGDLKGMVEAVN
jgi:hypothetical protein